MPGTKKQADAPLNSVYGELKLSEKLSEQLIEVKSVVDSLKEQLETATYYHELYKHQAEQSDLKL